MKAKVVNEVCLMLTEEEARHLTYILFQQTALRVGFNGASSAPGRRVHSPARILYMLQFVDKVAKTLSEVLPEKNPYLDNGMPS